MRCFDAHLSLEGPRSPFAVMCNKLSAAIRMDARVRNQILARKTEDILKEIYRQFDDMVDKKIEDGKETELREKFREYLEVVEPKFEDIKANLARIKLRYGQ